MAAPKRRRKKKSDKYTPLIWVLTGALIAFFISFPSSGKIKKLLPKQKTSHTSSRTNSRLSLSTLQSNLLGMHSQTTSLHSPTVETSSSMKAEQSSQNSEPEKHTFYIFLARQTPTALKIIKKSVLLDSDQTPLKDTLHKLITAEPDDGEFNLIPYQTKINKIWIRNGIAYIDFNDAFNYNSYGFTGYKVQLYQIVYTATQFPTVKAVYFYLGGKPLNVIGGEGFPINNPVYPYSSLPSFSTK